ncbi:hypothetical protein F3Y22_tig00112864pilonHSYRG00015 [Hibiscus syriacus]|uniref:Radical SAM core domain-containing protein n=1 Tax=Hibiscus syriacus TaxID=106335 RepID=A0A6A2X9D3_HIBSY|nr:hypothetical protein F3Y22_tig00112864pilonHSYRG00015 [Hibiscus syriacus]
MVQSHGFRPGQALMLWKRLYGDNIWAHGIDELEGLNKDFKKMLSEHAEIRALSLKDIRTASDGTRKEVADFVRAGPTDWMGLRRYLTAAEIVEQAVHARRLLYGDIGSITNVVFMGMGEPFHNIENVIKAADIMVDEQGLHFSPRKVTVSTSGLVPHLKRFLHESKCALAVSLNATTDETECQWVSISFLCNVETSISQYIEDANRLIDRVKGIPCKINLIFFNPHSGSQFRPSSDEKMIEFRNVLAKGGCTVFMRFSRGDDQMAACGQLGNPGSIKAPLLRVPEQFRVALNTGTST